MREKDLNVDDYSDDSLFNIASWGADMSFRELIQMYSEGELVRPEFQRNYVWKKYEASRFIESILLGLPVPSIFLSNAGDARKLIIDGYQRIMTIYDYVQRKKFGIEDGIFRLMNTDKINKRWRNKAFDELSIEDQRRLRSSTIHAIVFEQRLPKDDDTSMFQIFSRINTSGKSLNAQEIRNCVCQGPFNELLFKLNEETQWRELYGSEKKDPRMLDIELILRYFGMRDLMSRVETKKKINLRQYLDIYMQSRRMDKLDCEAKSFTRMVSFIYKYFGPFAFTSSLEKNSSEKYKLNPLIFEALAVSTDIFLSQKEEMCIVPPDLWERRTVLLEDPAFKKASLRRTTDFANIEQRIGLAAKVLYGLEK